MKIKIFIQHDTSFKDVAAITIPNLYQYARKHGYDIHESFGHPIRRGVIWDRFAIMPENAGDADWLIHMDADVLITNRHIRLEELIDPAFGIIMANCTCEDYALRLNDGVAIFKNCDEVRATMQEIFNDPVENNARYGQDVLQRMKDDGQLTHLLKLERQKAMNSFLYTEYNMPPTTLGHWTPGDFVLHLPGVDNKRRVETFRKTLADILW